MTKAPVRIARRYVAAINRHDLDALADLMLVRHRFVDSLGTAVEGREAMRQGWEAYFGMFPDYRIEIRGVATDGATVLLTGFASGTLAAGRKPLPERRWRIPAAWRCRVVRGRVAEWQVYADNDPVRRILAER